MDMEIWNVYYTCKGVLIANKGTGPELEVVVGVDVEDEEFVFDSPPDSFLGPGPDDPGLNMALGGPLSICGGGIGPPRIMGWRIGPRKVIGCRNGGPKWGCMPGGIIRRKGGMGPPNGGKNRPGGGIRPMIPPRKKRPLAPRPRL